MSLWAYLRRKEWTCSLRTQDYAEAKAISLTLHDETQKLFQAAYTGQRINLTTLAQLVKRPKAGRGQLPHLLGGISEPQESPSHTATTASYVFDAYIAECVADRPKTMQKKKAVFALWVEIMGDMPLQEVGKAQARDFKQTLMKLPSNMRKRYKGQTAKTIDLSVVPDGQRLSVKSVNGHLSILAAFINWAIRNGYYQAANPFVGLRLKETEREEDKKHPFSPEQLKAIFSSPVYAGCKFDNTHGRRILGNIVIKDCMFWIPLIALYSGARLQEICQLYTNDIKQVEGIWVFDFNEDGEDKRLKTSASRRKTPIHPKLIELGILEYRTSQQMADKMRLFSDILRGSDDTYSSVFSKRFSHFLHRTGIKTAKTSFHSFRHTFIDTLRNTDVPREVRETLVGHSGHKTAHDFYGSIIGIKRLYEGITKLNFDLFH